MRRQLTFAVSIALSVGLAGCGDDGGSDTADEGDGPNFTEVELPEEADPYVDALVVELTSEPTLPIPFDQARCIAGRMVQVFRLERLEAAGIEPDQLAEGNLVFEGMELSDDDGLKLVDAFQQCDYDLYDALFDSMVLGTADEGEARRCLEATLSRDALREAMAASFTATAVEDDVPEMDALSNAMFACVVDEDFGEFEEIEGEL